MHVHKHGKEPPPTIDVAQLLPLWQWVAVTSRIENLTAKGMAPISISLVSIGGQLCAPSID